MAKSRSPAEDWLNAQAKPWAWQLRWQQALALAGQLCWLAFLWLLASQIASWITGPALTWWPWMLALALIRVGLVGYEQRLAERLADSITAQARADVLRHWQQQGPALAQQLGSAVLANQAMQAVDDLQPYYQHYLRDRFLAFALPLLMLPWLFVHNWLAATMLLLSWPLIPLFMTLIGMGAQRISLTWRQQQDYLASYFVDRLQGLMSLRWAGLGDSEAHALEQASLQYRDLSMKTLKVAFLSSAVLEFFSAIAIASLAVYIGMSLLGYLQWPVAVQLNLALGLGILLWAPEFFAPLRTWAQSYHDRAKALAAAQQLQGQCSVQLRQGSWRALLSDGPDLRARLRLRRQGQRLPLPDIDLHAQPGQLVWLRGASGRGKSTLLHTLAGFLPADGQVQLPIGCQHVGWLGQRPWLQAGTVADNLRLLAPDASDEQLWQALAQVGLAEALAALPQQLHSVLGDAGQGLSGGQAQRLAIARLLLSPAPLMLLDEPGQYLDHASWHGVLPLFRQLADQGRILIVASHDPGLANVADLELHLDQEQGPLRAQPLTAIRPEARVEPATAATSQHEPAASATMVIPDMPLLAPSEASWSLLRPWLALQSSQGRWWALAAGLLLLTLLSGMALLALSGWFLTMSALSGLALLLLIDIYSPSTGIRFFALLRTLARYAERVLHHQLILTLLATMRVRLFARLLALPRHRSWHLAGLHWWQRLTQDLDRLDQLYLRALLPPALAWLLTLASALLLLGWQPILAWPLLAALVLLPLLWGWLLLSSGHDQSQQRQQQQGLLQALYHQANSLAEHDLSSLTQPPSWQSWQQGYQTRRAQVAGRLRRANQWLLAGQSSILLYWLWALPTQVWTWPEWALVVAMILAFLALYEAWQVVPSSAQSLQQARLAAQALALPDPELEPEPDSEPTSVLHRSSLAAGSGLHWQGLSLRYPGALSPSLVDENWQLPVRGLALLLGPSGSGKSTLLQLLQRELLPSTGSLVWQGRNLADWPLAQYRQQFSLLEQRPHLFAASARYNLTLGAEVSDQRLQQVLQRLGLDTWWQQQAEGGQRLLGEQGLMVSEGQARRLALARVLLNPRPLVLLDEPLASLDVDRQQGVMAAILELAEQSLVLVGQHQADPWPVGSKQYWLRSS